LEPPHDLFSPNRSLPRHPPRPPPPPPLPLTTPSTSPPLVDLGDPIGIYGGGAWISASPPTIRLWFARSSLPPSLRHHHQNWSTMSVASISSLQSITSTSIGPHHGFLPANGKRGVPSLLCWYNTFVRSVLVETRCRCY
uniref:Uncharacterized protein n=1 Tax=Triticum urartu TaxID=4572 RepID=A0A8R7U320_TRIUA